MICQPAMSSFGYEGSQKDLKTLDADVLADILQWTGLPLDWRPIWPMVAVSRVIGRTPTSPKCASYSAMISVETIDASPEAMVLI